jgi:hypothetical protein
MCPFHGEVHSFVSTNQTMTKVSKARQSQGVKEMRFKTQEEHRWAAEAAGLEYAKRQTIAAVYQKFPLMTRCEANERMILELIKRWANWPDVIPSIELFLNALDENPEAINDFAQQPEVKIRQQLSEQIIDLLREKGKGHDEFTLKQEAKRHELLSLEELRARLADLQMKAKMAATPVTELKQFVADAHRPALQTKVLPAEYTRERIRSMPPDAIKRLVRDYTASVVNDRLFGRS